MNEMMGMYDPVCDAPRHTQARSVDAWMRAAAYAAGSDADDDVLAEAQDRPFDEMDLGQAVECKKRDNLALGEALVSIGLIDHHELARVESDQAESDDLVGSLMVASAIRSRLGEILLKSNRLTSSQLEFALDMQRNEGGLLGEILLSLGWVDRFTLNAALAAQAGRKAA